MIRGTGVHRPLSGSERTAKGVGLNVELEPEFFPEQRERQRRQRLAQIGRICDGTVLDVQEISANGRGSTQLLIYSYDVGGVSYEASQDVTHLRQIADIESCKLGLPSSVRYDPRNPGNSIVISESWTGLRTKSGFRR